MRIPNSRFINCLALCVSGLYAAAGTAGSRVVAPEDYYRFLNVTDPQISADGSRVAYVVSRNDRSTDAALGSVWFVNWDGSDAHALTQGESASQPRFSPDGRYVSFLSARPADSMPQIWLIDLHGGEARQATHAAAEISHHAWSPDGRQLLLVMAGAKADSEGSKSPKPIVIDGYRFKADEQGYLNSDSHKRLYLLDVSNGTQTAITTNAEYNDDDAVWAPDGKSIAYVSNHRPDAERGGMDEIYVVEPRAGATPRRLAAVYAPNTQHLLFSPDGKYLYFLQGMAPKYNAYIEDRMVRAAVSTGIVQPVTERLDQQVSMPALSADGSSINFVVEDRGAAYISSSKIADGKIERVTPDRITVLGQSTGGGHSVILGSTDAQPPEILALDGAEIRPLTTHNQALMAELTLGSVEDISFKSRDGTLILGQIVKPPSYVAGRRYPTVVWIHGGPNGQDQHELIAEGYSPSLERQLLAAQGYVMLAVNYRGSTGRGLKFQQSIFADWGHKEVEDLLAAVDHAVAQGIADPAKLGIGGWSYGGLLTDYTIASDVRFKAAISGAGSGNQIGIYGVDEYVLQYNNELGPPWKNTALYVKLSYPFFHADRIHTPTLFMGGEKDFNVPIAGGEQMYQALRTLGVPTQLVVYPGEYHVFTRPSFLKDRAERYIAWYAKYLH